jgi:hypothetical protein
LKKLISLLGILESGFSRLDYTETVENTYSLEHHVLSQTASVDCIDHLNLYRKD